MSDFTIKGPDGNKFDSNKRVRYSTGLVLGVDEFQQEQFFFLERDHLHQRGLHGYGVVCGLDVTLDGDKVNVGPGHAVDQLGRNVRVDHTQCGDLGDWLAQQADSALATVYVTLCYRECETDSVPVPGAPCRSDDETVAPSRITSGFEIRFQAQPPDQDFENAVRLFGSMLAAIRGRASGALLDIQQTVTDFKTEFETLRANGGTPSEILVRQIQFDALMAGLLDLWVREIKPGLKLATANCGIEGADEGCVLLATLSRSGDIWSAAFTGRPLLLSTRMLQEYQRRRDTQVIDHGHLVGLSHDDHTQYLRRDGYRQMLGNLRFRALDGDRKLKITGLADGEAEGEALLWGQAASGDLRGTYPAPKVVAIFGLPVKYASNKPNGAVMVLGGSGADRAWAVRKLKQVDLSDRPQLALDELTDCSVATAADGQLLGFAAGVWKPVPKPDAQALDDLTDCETAGAAAGHHLVYDGGQWRPTAPPAPPQFPDVPNTLGELDDCDVAAAAVGHHLVFNGTAWQPQMPPVPADIPNTLGELDDCDVAAPGIGQHLAWNGNRWVPVNPPDGGGGPGLPAGNEPGEIMVWSGAAWKPQAPRCIELANIEFVADLDEALLFEVWFHPDAPTNEAEIVWLNQEMLEVLFENNDPNQGFLAPAVVTDVQPLMVNAMPTRNVFVVKVEYPRDREGKMFRSPFCRFRFFSEGIPVRKVGDVNEIKLMDFAVERGLSYEGQAPDRRLITQFVRIVPNNQAGSSSTDIKPAMDGAVDSVMVGTDGIKYDPYKTGLLIDSGGNVTDHLMIDSATFADPNGDGTP